MLITEKRIGGGGRFKWFRQTPSIFCCLLALQNTRVKRDHRQRRNVQPTTGFPFRQFQTARLTTGWGLKRTTSGLPLARTGITRGFRRQTTRGYGGVAGNQPFGGSTRWSPMHTNPPNLIPRQPDSGGPNDIDPVDEESSPKISKSA